MFLVNVLILYEIVLKFYYQLKRLSIFFGLNYEKNFNQKVVEIYILLIISIDMFVTKVLTQLTLLYI